MMVMHLSRERFSTKKFKHVDNSKAYKPEIRANIYFVTKKTDNPEGDIVR
jgi:hypothetical protein